MPYEEAVEMLKKSIKKMYGKKAEQQFSKGVGNLVRKVCLPDVNLGSLCQER